VNKEASRHLDLDNGPRNAVGARQLHPFDVGRDRRLDRIVADAADDLLNGIEVFGRDSQDGPSPVIDPQDADPPLAVGKSRQLVRQRITMRSTHPAAREGNALQLQNGIFAQPDFGQQIFGVIEHCRSGQLCRRMGPASTIGQHATIRATSIDHCGPFRDGGENFRLTVVLLHV
jgi:hypothetical protein